MLVSAAVDMAMKRSWLIFTVAAFFAAGFLLLWHNRGTVVGIMRDAIEQSFRELPEVVSHDEFEAKYGNDPRDALSVFSSGTLVNIVEEIPSSPRPSVTPPVTFRSFPNKPSSSPQAGIPPAINFDVPFTSQAPFENWELPFKEACEEASLLMVDRFYKGGRFTKRSATDAILALVSFERGRFGSDLDTTAEQTAAVAREYFRYQNVKVKYGPFSVNDLKKELAAGHPLIVPMAGRLLGNPYFRQPGPYYHMLVIKGYTATGFITNDPGTKRGADYEYSYAAVLNAMHDFDVVAITTTSQAMVVIYPNG